MNHRRVVKAVVVVTAVYFVGLCLWLTFLVRLAPPDTVGAQLMGIIASFGGALGVGLLWARRPSHADRKLFKHGYEGWAKIEHVRPLRRTRNFGELAEIELSLTVPGSQSYSGRVVHEVHYDETDKFVPGATIPIRVDPKDRDHIMLCP